MQHQRRRATVIGLGLIGGSIAKALKQAGWHVTGQDVDPDGEVQAQTLHIIDAAGIDAQSDIVFVAVPVLAIAAAVAAAAAVTACPITDVGSVKTPISEQLATLARFVPGHPMAGNEFTRLAGADANLFDGATWILTPTAATTEAAYATVHGVITTVLRARVVSMGADRHDRLMAAVSHVPHMTAAALMLSAEHIADTQVPALHALAAGGFRDMTRISAGEPAMWLDVAVQNREAMVQVFDELLVRLTKFRDVIADGDADMLQTLLRQAQHARRALPQRIIARYAEILIPIEDRVGVLREVTNLATDLDVNILDLDIEHNSEGNRGTLRLMVAEQAADRLYGGLRARHFNPTLARQGPGS